MALLACLAAATTHGAALTTSTLLATPSPATLPAAAMAAASLATGPTALTSCALDP